MDTINNDIDAWTKHNYPCARYKIDGDYNCTIIHNLLFKNIYTESDNDIVNLYYAYYYYKKQDEPNMLKHYLYLIDLNNSDAMYELARYYNLLEKYDIMMKYYLMSINLNNSKSMYALACYYKCNDDYDNMIKYYLAAANLKNKEAIISLAFYYRSVRDYDNQIKYFLLWSNNYGDIIENAYDDKRPKIFLILYNNHFKNISYTYKYNIIYYIHKFLINNVINSDLLILVSSINLKHFQYNTTLLKLIKKLLNNKIMLMDEQFKYIHY